VIGLPKIVVLRIGHRIPRDARITTHVCLVARAFGADGIIISDVIDDKLRQTIEGVVDRFGGAFYIKMGMPWKKVVSDWLLQGGEVVHLTVYGIPLPEVIEQLRASQRDKLVVVGGPKVPGEIYRIATYNVSITKQPHSEVASLSVFLDWYFQGKEFYKEFEGAKLKIGSSKSGKKVFRVESRHL
jgi:tRNA (cytidine56-2'-O)-methyltransferase